MQIMMKQNGILLVFALFTFVLGSCNSWLNVQPYDSMTEKQLYSTESGIQRALNGLYLSLASNSLYAENLSCGTLSVMSQNYFIGSEHVDYELSRYSHASEAPKQIYEDIWQSAYTLISDCNEFLEQAPLHREVMADAHYRMAIGEALAVRTLLHFDLFRLFGPAYREETKTSSSIPYYDTPTDITQPILTAGELMEHLVADVDSALLMLDEDVILTDGVVEGEDFWDYRNLRMNYYAAWALKARMCWYMGDEYAEEAFQIASSLLAGKDPRTQESNNFAEVFTSVTASEAVEDRVYFSECLFAVHNMQRDALYDALFSNDLSDNVILLSTSDYINNLFDMPTDCRLNNWENATGRESSTPLMNFVKYAEQAEHAYRPYLYEIQSVFRMSELYLIAAATAPDQEIAAGYLEDFRLTRAVEYQEGNMEGEDVNIVLEREWQKEFLGEGQFYYYMKRNGMTEFAGANGQVNISYDIPLPESETDNRRD